MEKKTSRALLWRGWSALAFGLCTVFCPDLPFDALKLATGAYLGVVAIAVFFSARVLRGSQITGDLWLGLDGVLLLAAALSMAIITDVRIYVTCMSTVMLLSGGSELCFAWKTARSIPVRRECCIAGLAACLTGVVLALLGMTSERAPGGILGGSAILVGVTLVLGGLSVPNEKLSSP